MRLIESMYEIFVSQQLKIYNWYSTFDPDSDGCPVKLTNHCLCYFRVLDFILCIVVYSFSLQLWKSFSPIKFLELLWLHHKRLSLFASMTKCFTSWNKYSSPKRSLYFKMCHQGTWTLWSLSMLFILKTWNLRQIIFL